MNVVRMNIGARVGGILGAIFFILLTIGLGAQAWAKDGDGEKEFFKDNPQSHRRFSDALEFFNSPSSFEGLSDDSLRIQFDEHGEVLKQYRFEEVAEKVNDALLTEVAYLDQLNKHGDLQYENVRFWFFADSFKILASIGNVSDLSNFDVVVTEMNKALGALNKQFLSANEERKTRGEPVLKLDPKIKAQIVAYARAAESLQALLPHREERRASAFDKDRRLQLFLGRNFLPAPSGEELLAGVRLANYESAKHKGVDWVAEVRERMKKKAKGQPEAIEVFMNMEFQRVMKPERTVPEVLWMLGIPGTGKDTHAEAYLDAIHGYAGAYEEHMKVLEVSRDKSDIWTLFGSKPGHVGSDRQSELIRFLVKHSGGRYKIELVKSFNDMVERVVETGVTTVENTPNTGVLYVNELHNWSRTSIDILLKKAIEKGTFPINNANGGVSMIKVPITIVIASNDGMELVVPEGHTKGRKLSYQEVHELWESNHLDYDRIKESIKQKNIVRIGEKIDSETGISPEMLNRIKTSNMILMRPLSPEVLLEIARLRVEKLTATYAHAGAILGQTKFEFADEVAVRLQEFLFDPEEGARFLDSSVVSLVESVIDRAIADKQIQGADEGRKVLVDVVTNLDGTWSLKISFRSLEGDVVLGDDLFLPIGATQNMATKLPMTDEEILKVLDFEKAFNQGIVGADHLSKKLQEALLASENARHAGKEDRAQAFMFLGMSSTGKSQAAKVVAKFIQGNEADLVTIDFNGLVSEAQVRDIIFGSKNGLPSEVMKAFDRRRGRVVFLFDEIANVNNLNILTSLYQLLREKSIDLFNDGRPRSMEAVTIIMTGNAGEEIFHGIPDHVPERVRRAAAAEIYQKFVNSPLRQRAFLESRFREAFLNRVGYENTFFFSPLDFAAVRELIRIKLSAALKDLAGNNGRNYHVEFATDEDLEKFLDIYEKEGFRFKSQGQSIDDFASKQFHQKLLLVLEKNLVPNDARVALTYVNRTEVGEGDDSRSFENFDIHVEGSDAKYNLKLDGKIVEKDPIERHQDKVQTAFHEAAHEILRQALLQDLTKPKKISIIPGVTEIAGEYVYYAGVASYELHTKGAMTRKFVIAEMAKLIAGGEAQRLISRGHFAEGGQSNDLERANRFAKLAILKYGLDPTWGLAAPTSNQTIQEFMADLSERDTIRLETTVKGYMKEANQLARDVLAINYDAFIALGLELSKFGEINAKQILAVYEKHPVANYWEMGVVKRKLKSFNPSYFKTWLQGVLPYSGRDLVTVSSIPKIAEKDIADIDLILEAQRRDGIQKARLLGELPVKMKDTAQVGACAKLMGQLAKAG